MIHYVYIYIHIHLHPCFIDSLHVSLGRFVVSAGGKAQQPREFVDHRGQHGLRCHQAWLMEFVAENSFILCINDVRMVIYSGFYTAICHL